MARVGSTQPDLNGEGRCRESGSNDCDAAASEGATAGCARSAHRETHAATDEEDDGADPTAEAIPQPESTEHIYDGIG